MKIIALNIIIALLIITQPASSMINNDSSDIVTEASIEIEDWMFEELDSNLEEEALIEDWMMEELNPGQDSETILENWMFLPLSEETELEPELEDWMFI
jgi:hypothetical protein